MHRIPRAAFLLLPATLAIAACAVRLGSGGPAEYTTVVLRGAAGATSAQVAEQVRAAGGEIVLLTAQQDSAWFASVATEAGLELSGPGFTSGRGMAFLTTNLELLGDTSLMLAVEGGGSVHMHDALYRVDSYRDLDLMLVRFDAPDLRAAVRRLIDYIATDVGPSASVLLALDATTPQLADSAAVLLRALYTSELECPTVDTQAAARPEVRLLYGPTARVSCRSSRVLPGAPPGVAARIVVN